MDGSRAERRAERIARELAGEGEPLDRRLRAKCAVLEHCLAILMAEIVFERLPSGRIAARRVQELLAEAGIRIAGLGQPVDAA